MRARSGDASARRSKAGLAIALLTALACGNDPAAPPPGCGDVPSLTYGVPVEGTLSPSDGRIDGAYVDSYTIRLASGDMAVIEMESDDFSPLLHLFDADGRVVAQAFDRWPDGETETAHLVRSLPAGCYVVAASSWHGGATGSYSLVAFAAADPSDQHVAPAWLAAASP